MSRIKKRGVRASRIKLEAALAASDIPQKTQIALANAIADYEDLDSAPRDLVNKLFRERPVDPHTIERAARALGVNAATLYRTQDDPKLRLAPMDKSQSDDVSLQDQKRWLMPILALTLMSLIFGFYIIRDNAGNLPVQCTGLTALDGQTEPEKIGIVIGRFAGDINNEAQLLLAHNFAADDSLSESVNIFTTCYRLNIGEQRSYVSGLNILRDKAQSDLKVVDAQLFIWGERYNDRLNIRFATLRDGKAPVNLDLDGKIIATTELEFTLPIKLSADRPIPSSVKQLALDVLLVKTDMRIELRNDLRTNFVTAGNWLKEAVTTDRNLLRSISPEVNPRLYALTGQQLCYRHRLLGDYEGSEDEYVRAEQVCQDVLSHISPEQSPEEWFTAQTNLGSVIIRRHLFADTREGRIKELLRAKHEFEKAKPYISEQTSADNFHAYHKNLGIVHLRLGELTEGDESMDYLNTAMDLTKTSLETITQDKQREEYSSARQNMCLIGHRLAQRTKQTKFLKESIADCQIATTVITSTTAPQAWAMAQNNLAVSYAMMAEFTEDATAFEDALKEFTKSQSVYTRDKFPANWAEVQANKAELSCRLAVSSGDPSSLDDVGEYAESAREIFSDKNLDRYVDYVDNLLLKVSNCDRSNVKKCSCSS